jgi:hypothetical protein
VNVSTFTEEYNRTDYHTQYDTTASVDFDYLAQLTRVCVRLLAEADEDLDGLLDYEARARDLGEALGPHRVEGLERLCGLRGRKAFTSLGRGLHGLDAWERAAYPHVQTANDVDRLERALPLLREERWAEAADGLAGVGLNRLAADLSREAFRRERARVPGATERSTWGGQGDPDPGPDLWVELASLRREPSAREQGPWIVDRVERHLARSRRELERRLGRMTAAVAGKVPRQPKPRGCRWTRRRELGRRGPWRHA